MPVQLLISEGKMQTNLNGHVVDSKQYKAIYDGEKGHILMRDNNEGMYVQMDNEDLVDILNQRKDNNKIEDKLIKLLPDKSVSKKSRSKSKTKRKKSTKKRSKSKKSTTRSRTRSSKSKSRSKRRTRKKKSKSPKKTIQSLLKSIN